MAACAGATGLRLGGLAGLGAFTRGTAAAASPAPAPLPGHGRARSVLVIFTSGGRASSTPGTPSPTPRRRSAASSAPSPRAVPGTRLCEHLPRLARLADRFTIVRSMSHDDLDHGSATYLALTGQFHPRKSSNPPPRPTDLPTTGAILHRVRPARGLPCSAVHVNGPLLAPEIAGAGPVRRLPRPGVRAAGARRRLPGRCPRARPGAGAGAAGGAPRSGGARCLQAIDGFRSPDGGEPGPAGHERELPGGVRVSRLARPAGAPST